VTTLKPETFHEIGKAGEARAQGMLTRVKQALTSLAFDPYTQFNDKRVVYHPVTTKSKIAQLNRKDHPITQNYLQVWNDSTFEDTPLNTQLPPRKERPIRVNRRRERAA